MQTELTANRVRSIATGIMVFAGFGAGWLFWSLSMRRGITGATATGIWMGMLALFVAAIFIWRQAKRWPRVPDDPRVGRTFGWVNAVQWTAIFVAGFICKRYSWDLYFPSAVTAIVGLHFYPLARLFRNPLHYGTGTALVLWAFAAATIGADRLQGITAMGTGALLWAAALVTIARGLSIMRAGEAGGILGPGGPDLLVRMRGRTVGAIVCAGFGAYALYCWTRAAIEGERRPWFGAIAVATAIFAVWGIANLVRLRHEPRVELDKRLVRFYRIGYVLIVAIEGAAISVGGPILGHFHRPDLFGQWIGAVVGVHFFPLGKLFKLPLYYWTGVAISLAAFGSLLISASPLSSAICAGGTGGALWITAAVTLSKNLENLPAKTAPAV
jgi:hypothetical protein